MTIIINSFKYSVLMIGMTFAILQTIRSAYVGEFRLAVRASLVVNVDTFFSKK